MRPASDATLPLVVNAHHDVVLFTLPEVAGANRWYCVLDTNDPDRGELPDFTSHDRYEVTRRSLLLFVLEAHGETGRVLRRLAVELSGFSHSRRP
jgi:isoamylase